MNRLNKTESAVFLYCRFSLLLKDPFFPGYLKQAFSFKRVCNPRGGGGGTLIFSYICRLGSFHFWGGFQKIKHFWGYEDFVDIFWGHHKIGLYLGIISMHFRVFSYYYKGHCTEWGYFLGFLKLCLKFLVFFGVEG